MLTKEVHDDGHAFLLNVLQNTFLTFTRQLQSDAFHLCLLKILVRETVLHINSFPTGHWNTGIYVSQWKIWKLFIIQWMAPVVKHMKKMGCAIGCGWNIASFPQLSHHFIRWVTLGSNRYIMLDIFIVAFVAKNMIFANPQTYDGRAASSSPLSSSV